MDIDLTFRALADPTRRQLLDLLRARNGQTLNKLRADLDMTRQSATQHLDILAKANLVTVVRRGRERLHYLNPTPIHDIEQRWIAEFDRPRLAALHDIRTRAEEVTMIPIYVYVTYINASPEKVWQALTDADLTAQYWGHANVSDWQPGSTWEHRQLADAAVVDIVGEVREVDPPRRLVITFEDPHETSGREPSQVTFLIEPHVGLVRLTVTHENLPDQEMLDGISQGWPAVLANLKTLLETGSALDPAPWEMPTD